MKMAKKGEVYVAVNPIVVGLFDQMRLEEGDMVRVEDVGSTQYGILHPHTLTYENPASDYAGISTQTFHRNFKLVKE